MKSKEVKRGLMGKSTREPNETSLTQKTAILKWVNEDLKKRNAEMRALIETQKKEIKELQETAQRFIEALVEDAWERARQ